jgi:hypothetical protein
LGLLILLLLLLYITDIGSSDTITTTI